MAGSGREVLDARRAGVLLHVTSLPAGKKLAEIKGADPALGDFGGVCQFIDFLKGAGFTVWQLLPLGPPHQDFSPYLCTSSLAGNPLLIDLEWLSDLGWLSNALVFENFSSISEFRSACLHDAFCGFRDAAPDLLMMAYKKFVAEHDDWLADFSLFTAISRSRKGTPWMSWEEPIRQRQESVLQTLQLTMADQIEQVKFEQFVFYTQWLEIKSYANKQGILIVGDMPLFVAHDSVDVWANRSFFKVDRQGKAAVVAGVPPDYFSATGQKWGNPVYDWLQLENDHFQWWIDRLRSQLELYDLLRIDHFRGLEACWEIPVEAVSAESGAWKNPPGEALLQRLQDTFGHLPFIAEDLGFITQEVHKLREKFGLPGMKVMQFAFDGSSDNPYLLRNHVVNCVAYTGTHDNDTSLGWYQSLPADLRETIDNEMDRAGLEMPWSLIDYTFASPAKLAIVPMQDILALGAGHRLNTPGTAEGNWRWQFAWDQVTDVLSSNLYELVTRNQRLP